MSQDPGFSNRFLTNPSVLQQLEFRSYCCFEGLADVIDLDNFIKDVIRESVPFCPSKRGLNLCLGNHLALRVRTVAFISFRPPSLGCSMGLSSAICPRLSSSPNPRTSPAHFLRWGTSAVFVATWSQNISDTWMQNVVSTGYKLEFQSLPLSCFMLSKLPKSLQRPADLGDALTLPIFQGVISLFY